MKTFSKLLILVIMVALLSVGGVLAQDGGARLRFMHAIPGVSAIDIYTDGQLTVHNLNFGQSTTYINVPSGSHSLNVTPAGITTSLWQQQINADANSAQTLIASSTSPLAFNSFQEELSTLSFGNARLLLIHAVANGPTVDVALSDGTVIAPGIAYGAAFGTFDIPAGIYELAVVPAGGDVAEAVLGPAPFALNAGTLYMGVVYGTPNAPAAALLSTSAPGEGDTGLVRFAHTIVGAPAVDVFVNDVLIAPSLDLSRPTDHIALPSGDHTVALRPAGQDIDLVTNPLTVSTGTAQTIAAIGTSGEIAAVSFNDAVSGISADQAVVSVINAVAGSTAVDVTLADGTILAEGLPFGEAAEAMSIRPSEQGGSFSVTLESASGSIDVPAQSFYGGVYYNLFAISGDSFSPPRLILAPTSIAQGIASAPGAADAAVAAAPTNDASSEVVIGTPPAATQAPQAPAAAATTAPASGPSARVLLDPGANLQLRQYPSSTALSLGLAPSGTVLTVNGREGAPVFLEGQATPVGEPEFVDPALALTDEKEDLAPDGTWLSVSYTTPDGGIITAWVNALYLEVRNAKGELQRLADLPFVPRNQAGAAESTAITPPPIPQDQVTAVVYNLDTGVNLNIRRTPATDGEVLERIPNGTVAEFLGLNEVGDWAFINYLPAGGGSISGWVGTLYVRYEYNGRSIDVEEMIERNLLTIIEDTRRGEIGSGAVQAALPTPDPLKDVYVGQILLDPNANLHLRRNPDSTSESLDLIPADTQVIIHTRTGDAAWLEVEFEGQTGWIAATFVDITFNGDRVEIFEIPLASGQLEVPTPTPTQTGQ